MHTHCRFPSRRWWNRWSRPLASSSRYDSITFACACRSRHTQLLGAGSAEADQIQETKGHAECDTSVASANLAGPTQWQAGRSGTACNEGAGAPTPYARALSGQGRSTVIDVILRFCPASAAGHLHCLR